VSIAVTRLDALLQLILWGYAITGDACEKSALVAEGHNGHLWDHGAAWLAGLTIAQYGETRQVKDWAALPWVTEHLLRTGAGWPGL